MDALHTPARKGGWDSWKESVAGACGIDVLDPSCSRLRPTFSPEPDVQQHSAANTYPLHQGHKQVASNTQHRLDVLIDSEKRLTQKLRFRADGCGFRATENLHLEVMARQKVEHHNGCTASLLGASRVATRMRAPNIGLLLSL